MIRSSQLVCGHTLEDLSLPDGTLIVSIIRGQSMLVPNGKTVLESGDRIIFLYF